MAKLNGVKAFGVGTLRNSSAIVYLGVTGLYEQSGLQGTVQVANGVFEDVSYNLCGDRSGACFAMATGIPIETVGSATDSFFSSLRAAILGSRESAAIEGENATYLYQKVSAEGEHLKFGITNNPATRYTPAELNGGALRLVASGPRAKMLALERELHSTLPIGPEERQVFYIRIQVEKGLAPPPY